MLPRIYVRLGRRPRQIDPGLARSVAGQVVAGLTRDSGNRPDASPDQRHAATRRELERARASLIAVGLMVRNTAQDPAVDDVLKLADRYLVEADPR